ncbi:hypothetical protein GF361_04750 [Candidatus Woesearchaeota archaeon]|nr:hypothetical protein [Candidatus Woesearchaeota archaeon]
MNIQCLKCKGRGFCGRKFCPILAKSEAVFKLKKTVSKQGFMGSSPSPFIGHYGYPYLNVGILSTPEIKKNAWEYDAPKHWASQNYQIRQIIDFRSSLINSRFKAHAQDKNKFLDISREIGMSKKPVELEVNLKQKPQFRLKTDSVNQPMGPNANLEKAKITSNPKIPKKVDKVYSDSDLKANDALIYLYENKFDENDLNKLLSIGTLGLKKSRKLVPTRWSITATDDMLAKYLLEEIRWFPEIDYQAYFGSYLGNYYLILCFPGPWTYELFETYLPKSSWNRSDEISYMTDYENFEGRKSYAQNCGGGYYAAKLPITEKLRKINRQGTVLALRFITGDYAVPLGVWVVREATRKSLNQKPIEFSDRELMLKYAKALIKKKFNYDLNKLLKKSIILNNIKNQTKLSSFF